MPKWMWSLIVGGVVVLGGIAWLWGSRLLTPASQGYREDVLAVLRGRGGLDPGLAFVLRGLIGDLNCRDEALCLRKENFTEALDLAEQYEHILGDYLGQICRSGRIRPGAADRIQHEQLCHSLEALFKEVGGIKMNASLALSMLTRNDPEEVRSLVRRFWERILAHRERVLQIAAELQKITWLEPVVRTEPQPAP